eukprot:7142002-Heterocapsa_arctica.AAC.1
MGRGSCSMGTMHIAPSGPMNLYHALCSRSSTQCLPPLIVVTWPARPADTMRTEDFMGVPSQEYEKSTGRPSALAT